MTPTLTFVMNALGNPTGGKQQGFTQASNLGLDLRFDREKLFGLAGGLFEISFSERFGSSPSREDIGNVFSVQQVFGGETYRLVDVAYQQQLLDGRLELRVGRIAAGDDFLVLPYTYVFVQNGFDGNPVGIFFNAPGMTAYPNATWGGLVRRVRALCRGRRRLHSERVGPRARDPRQDARADVGRCGARGVVYGWSRRPGRQRGPSEAGRPAPGVSARGLAAAGSPSRARWQAGAAIGQNCLRAPAVVTRSPCPCRARRLRSDQTSRQHADRGHREGRSAGRSAPLWAI
jgi:hypothetical protein